MNSYVSINQYVKEVKKFKHLNTKEEKELSKRINKGDDSARKELIEANLKLVLFVANKYRNKGIDLADIISEGNMGLIRAAQNWKGERGSRFSAYASFYIKKHILMCISNRYPVSMPINMAIASNSLRNKLRKYENESNGTVSDSEVKKRFGKTYQGVSVDSILNNTRITHSGLTYKKAHTDEEIDRTDTPLVTESFLRELENEDARKKIKEKINSILSRARYGNMVKSIYGLDGKKPLSFETIGKMKKVSGQCIRDKRNILFDRIRRQYKKEDFLDYTTS